MGRSISSSSSCPGGPRGRAEYERARRRRDTIGLATELPRRTARSNCFWMGMIGRPSWWYQYPLCLAQRSLSVIPISQYMCLMIDVEEVV